MKLSPLALTAATLALTAPFVSAPVAQAAAFDDASLPIFSELTIDSITAKVTRGINLEDDPNGSLGAFSDFYYSDGITTLDFNSAPQAVAGQENAYTFGDESMVFTFDKALGDRSDIISGDKKVWAPTGANGERNTSDYLGIFKGNSLTIDLEDSLNYFGMNWGALSGGNTFEFFQVDDSGSETSLGMFDYDKVFRSGDSVLPTLANHQDEYNGYVHFYANEVDGLFNRIRVTQLGGGGFETDNYSLRASDQAFDFETGQDVTEVPEPSALLGLGAIVAGLAARRRRSAEVAA